MRRKLPWIVLALLALTAIAVARPGGGESYSGRGGHGGGSSSGGGDSGAILELVFHLLRLIFYYPKVGIPLAIIVIGWFVYSSYKQRINADWDSGPPVQLESAADLVELRRVDASFSQPVFEDFVFRLYATAHRVRHDATQLAGLAPYVGGQARMALAGREPQGVPITGVVVGAIRATDVVLTDPVRVAVEFEANLATAAQTLFVVERWTLIRAAGAMTKPPDPSRVLRCPNCGAPWAAKDARGTQICASCDQVVDNGRFDWQVATIQLRSAAERGPTLTEDVPERGTDLATYMQPAVEARFATLQARDPAVDRTAFLARVAMIYAQLNAAWAANDLSSVRGLLTDGIYDYLQYWIDAYKAQGLRNVLEGMTLEQTEIAKVSSDRYYDAIVVRIWGTGRDYVVRTDGALVRGSKHRSRKYSEYWTLIRAAGRTGAVKTEPACSNCGAALQVAQSGACEYCGAHVTLGEFDWVLSKIEQDDSYRG